ncbi:MAG: IclR family transcriptional regulator [Woeseiaceae bacterium]|nr:IclR family transcriptional regulator [Woeseiaceae bacterium]
MSALSKGFRILEAITAAGAGLTFSRIVDETQLPKGTAHRLLKELVQLSALSYDDNTRRYRGALKLASMGAAVTQNYDVRQIARPHLEDLQAKTGSVATLGIRDGEKGIYIDKIEPADFVIRLHSEIGKSFPLHCTAMGKVLLANSDPDTLAKVTRRKLRRYTENTITDGPALRRELDAVAERGYAVDDEEITRGLVCVAAPVHTPAGEVTAAVSCTISSFGATLKTIETLARDVVECAEAASF